jgi:hypothetical protein
MFALNWLTGFREFKKSSCEKPPSQLNCDFAGMIVNRLPIGISR